ncbi:MAG: hypothetical protein IKA96_06095, partial [Alistipes sp.]|nr:hypothetical protein [Alistipes sp.]
SLFLILPYCSSARIEKKQRAVSTLQTKLSVARLDSSAAGQARVRELEAELKEAQEDLEDFTLEHAIDVLTDQLDNQYKQYENFIETKVSEITAAINGVTAAIQGSATSSSEQIKQLIEQYKQEHPEVENPKPEPEPTSKNRWTSYQDAADAGFSNILGASGSERSRATQQYGSYQNYLDAMYYKYMGKNPEGVTTIPQKITTTTTTQKTPTVTASKYAQAGLNIGSTTYSKSEYNSKIKKDSSGNTYIPYTAYGQKDEWVKLGEGYTYEEKDGNIKIDWHSFKPTYKLTTSYHTGGFVGDISALASNEEFAKLLKGEFVSTPAQMKRCMEETLPRIANYTATGGTNEFNAPLIEILCESVTSESLPELKRIVEEAVKELQKQLDSGMSRTGFKRTPTKRLT